MVSANHNLGDFQYIALSTVGIIFLGTPHRGTQAAAWGEFVARSGRFFGLGAETSILRDLQADSRDLRDLLYEFTLWANRAPLSLVCCFEQHATDYGKRFGMRWKKLVRHQRPLVFVDVSKLKPRKGCGRDLSLYRWSSKGASTDGSFEDKQV